MQSAADQATAQRERERAPQPPSPKKASDMSGECEGEEEEAGSEPDGCVDSDASTKVLGS